jgi:HPt (histidine-containing phosphotransfer) domain-containing protein
MTQVRSPWAFDRAAALHRLDDDEELLNDVIEQFLADAPAALSAIDGAIRKGDGPGLRDAAHGLKGAAGYLAADELCVAAQELEGLGRASQMSTARQVAPKFEVLASDVMNALRAALMAARG